MAQASTYCPPRRVRPADDPDPGEQAALLSGLHEIKHDGYRMQVVKAGDRIRLFTRRGGDWTLRYPRVVRAAEKLRAKSFAVDGEHIVADESR